MAVWTYNDVEGVLEHITLREKYRDGVLAGYQLRAHEGYAIYDTTEELFVHPETGEVYPPAYSYQVNCGLQSNYMRYKATPITPDMEVNGDTNNNHEVM